MTIITIALKVLDHTIFELTIDGLIETTTTTDDDDRDVTVVKDANVINWDNQPEP